jgi:hypothetical protein
MAGAPAGNRNGVKKNRLLTDTLKRELTQNPEDALLIARKLIECAKAGESWAQSLIHERVDGKVPQAIVGDDEEAPIRTVSRIELVDLVTDSSGQASPEA